MRRRAQEILPLHAIGPQPWQLLNHASYHQVCLYSRQFRQTRQLITEFKAGCLRCKDGLRCVPELMGVQGGRLAMNLGGRWPNSTSTRLLAGPCWLALPRLCTASFNRLYVTCSASRVTSQMLHPQQRQQPETSHYHCNDAEMVAVGVMPDSVISVIRTKISQYYIGQCNSYYAVEQDNCEHLPSWLLLPAVWHRAQTYKVMSYGMHGMEGVQV